MSPSVSSTQPASGSTVSGTVFTYTAQNSGDYIRYSVYASNFANFSQNFLADCLSLWGP